MDDFITTMQLMYKSKHHLRYNEEWMNKGQRKKQEYFQSNFALIRKFPKELFAMAKGFLAHDASHYFQVYTKWVTLLRKKTLIEDGNAQKQRRIRAFAKLVKGVELYSHIVM